MIRTTVLLTKTQYETLGRLAKADPAGTKFSQLIRTFIAEGIERRAVSKIGK